MSPQFIKFLKLCGVSLLVFANIVAILVAIGMSKASYDYYTTGQLLVGVTNQTHTDWGVICLNVVNIIALLLSLTIGLKKGWRALQINIYILIFWPLVEFLYLYLFP